MGGRWKDLISNIKVWKRGDQRAPHKPLLTLLLLARAQRGESAFVSFSEIHEKLTEALRNFGPQRKSYHPEFPFWYLKNDGFWTVRDADSLPYRTGKSSPTKGTLLAREVVGEVPKDLWSELESSPSLIPQLALILLNEHWPPSLHQDLVDFLGINLSAPDAASDTLMQMVKRNPRSPEFRVEVLRAYERRCAVCGYDARIGDALFGLEAAHIKWHAYGGADVVPNGLALCSLHHIAFDRGAIGIDDDLRVRVSQDVTGGDEVSRFLVDFNGAPLREPQDNALIPAAEFLNWHHKWVFRSPQRRVG